MFYVLDLYDYRVRFHFLFSLSCNFLCYSLLTITNLGFFLVTFVPFYINFVLFILFILTGSFCSLNWVLFISPLYVVPSFVSVHFFSLQSALFIRGLGIHSSVFRANLLIFCFCERKCDSLVFLSTSHFCSFLKSNVRELLTVALL